MADAGKIMIMPKGAYDTSASYEVLDLVTHNDKAWIAKKNATGIEPSEENSEHWFLLVSNSTVDDILNGTTPVGDSNKLGGKDASEYLAKTGGTLNGNLFAGTSEAKARTVGMYNPSREIYNQVTADGTYKIFDVTNDKTIMQSTKDGTNTFNGTASGNLPKSGGTLESKNAEVLTIQRQYDSSGVQAKIGFRRINEFYGALGFSSANIPLFIDTSGANEYKLFHEGNKPTGTYTGNGSSTSRTISTGGIGGALLVYGGGNAGAAIVTPMGAICVKYSDGTVYGLKKGVANYNEGTLTLATTDAILNSASGTHTYKHL